MKKIVLITACLLLILPSFLTAAANKGEENLSEKEGTVASKDEVVYATLHPNGESQGLYIVNTLDVTEPGKIIDYGNYATLKNLTDLSELSQREDRVEITAPEGKFFYQGNMDTKKLPWEFSISYFLDGDEILPKELAGKDGHLEIKMDTAANDSVDSRFYENYLLQISLSLDTAKAINIKTEEGMVANAGKNKQVTFTVMPDEEGELAVEADVTDFEMSGIDITAVPSNISIDAPDTDDLTGEMTILSDAIVEIKDGMGELKEGVSELNEGTIALRNGSNEYSNGMNALDGGSAELISGSSSIDQALEMMNDALSATEDIDVSELEQLTDGLGELSSGLTEIADGLSTLLENYGAAYQALDAAMHAIPAHEVTDDEIEALYRSGADQETVNQLVEVYTAALTAKGTYDQINQAFTAVDSTLQSVIDSLQTMADHVDTMINEFSASIGEMDVANGFTELQERIAALSANYKSFHAGLVDYTGGVSELASGYKELDAGIIELNDGTGELANGAAALHDGTSKLNDTTSDMPEQMKEEIDKMISEYDYSDFEATSFVSEKNENVDTVQFVLKTESIEVEKVETEEEPEVEEKGIWQRFLDLFS